MLKSFLTSATKIVLTITAIVVLLILNWKVWMKDRTQEETIKALQKELLVQQKINKEIRITNDNLHRRIDSLKQGSVEMIEEEARNKFNMVGEGETFIDFKVHSNSD